jgi:hypothetical protein
LIVVRQDGRLRLTLVRGVPAAEHPPFDYKDDRHVHFLDQGWQERRFLLVATDGGHEALPPLDRLAEEFQVSVIPMLDSGHPGKEPWEASWKGRHLAGEAAVTSRRLGRGAVLYVGTYFTAEVVAALAPVLAKLGVLPAPVVAVAGVETVVRSGAGKRLRFLINHNETTVRVPLPSGGRELISDVPVAGEIELAAGDVAVVREDLITN